MLEVIYKLSKKIVRLINIAHLQRFRGRAVDRVFVFTLLSTLANIP